MHARQHVARLACAAALLIGSGCSPSSSGASVTCSPPECPADTTLQLVAEVDPPSDSSFVRQEFGSVTIDPQSGLFALALDAQVTLSGVVQVKSGTSTKNVAATVVATRPSRIPGRPDVTYQTTVNPVSGHYTLVVSRNVAGEKYALRVTTTDPSQAPPMLTTVTADGDQEVDLLFDDLLKLPELHGSILDSLGTPVDGMQVQAIDPTTSQVVSTTTTSDATGAFSVRLVASPPASVRLSSTPPVGQPLPSLALDVATAKLSSTNSLTANLMMPPLPAVAHLTYTVSGMGTSGAQAPVTASCIFVADVSDPHATDGTTASYRTISSTDALGNVMVDLIPNESGNRTYVVTVTPDASSDFEALTSTINVGPQDGIGQPINLTLRPQLSGRVLDPSGKPLKNLMVVPAAATVAASLGTNSFVAPATPRQTTADADGRFAVRLDPGTWDIGLIPPADAMLPRLWLAQIDISDGADVELGAVPVPRGVMVHGVVHDPSGAALAKADVRLYTVAAGNATCGSDKRCLAPPRLRAEGSSGTDGVVALILPSQPVP